MKVEITKLYCVRVLDNDGNELDCEYVFGNKEEAKTVGAELKEKQVQLMKEEK